MSSNRKRKLDVNSNGDSDIKMDYRSRCDINKIETISSSIDPKQFFDKYISRRIPVKFDNLINDTLFKKDDFTLKSLEHIAGEAKLRVEHRQSNSDNYGEGKEIDMKFKDFLSEMEKNNELFYLTAQELTYDLENKPTLYNSPITELLESESIPIQPNLVNSLILQNINIWIGCHNAQNLNSASSTGLHHDYHDNIYMMLHGKKTFRLIDPSYVEALYPVGKLIKIHANGRFNYENEETEADGRNPASEAAQLASKRLMELTATTNKKKVEESEIGSESNEDEIEDALEALLDAECDGWEGEDDEDLDSVSGDEEECEGTLPVAWMSSSALKSALSQDHEKPKKQKRECKADSTGPPNSTLESDVKPVPVNFSQVGVLPSSLELPLSTDSKNNPNKNTMSIEESKGLLEKFPKFHELLQKKMENKAPGFFEVTIEEGEMLYIPAGWYHEVRSSGDDSNSDYVHTALNYWFHPPDTSTYEKPYSNDFWKNDWIERYGVK